MKKILQGVVVFFQGAAMRMKFFYNMKLSTKLLLGFGVMIAITVLGFGGGSRTLSTIGYQIEISNDSNWLIESAQKGSILQRDFLLGARDGIPDEVEELTQSFQARQKSLAEGLINPEEREMATQVGQRFETWAGAFQKTAELQVTQINAKAEMGKLAEETVAIIESLNSDQVRGLYSALYSRKMGLEIWNHVANVDEANRLQRQVLMARNAEKNYIIDHDEKWLKVFDRAKAEILLVAEGMKKRFNDGSFQKRLETVLDAMNKYGEAFHSFHNALSQQQAQEKMMTQELEDLNKLVFQFREEQLNQLGSKIVFAKMSTVALGGFMVFLGLAFAGLMIFTIRHPIKEAIDRINASARSINVAAQDVVSTSQQLDTSVEDEVKGIRDISSAIMAISNEVKRNVENTDSTARLSKRIREVTGDASKVMNDLVLSMEHILESNRKLQDLVSVISVIKAKTEMINTIVFKTSLISFNASIEASRAGEQGRGFAVVAEEIGNLANLSGDSANEITNIVESSIKEVKQLTLTNKENVEGGYILLKRSVELLKEVGTAVAEMDQNTETVTAGSKLQAQHVIDIESRIRQLDTTTDVNLKNAQTSTKSGFSLRQEAGSLETVVEDLEKIVNG